MNSVPKICLDVGKGGGREVRLLVEVSLLDNLSVHLFGGAGGGREGKIRLRIGLKIRECAVYMKDKCTNIL